MVEDVEIGERQASDRGFRLQRAADASHVRARRTGTVLVAVSALIALLGPLAGAADGLAAVTGAVGGAWAIVALVVDRKVLRSRVAEARTIQEQFDRWLFDLPWTHPEVGPIPTERVSELARSSSLPRAVADTWYPAVTGVPPAYGVLLCQRMNLAWDSRLRRRLARLLFAFCVSWVVAGLAVGIALDSSLREFTGSWLLPSSALLALALEQAMSHRELALERGQLYETVVSELSQASRARASQDPARLAELCGRVQDKLFVIRSRSGRVPEYVYKRHRSEDEIDMAATVAELRDRLE